MADTPPVVAPSTASAVSVWLTVPESAERARVGVQTIYRAVTAGQLRAARVGGRRQLRLRAEWIDAWLDACATPVDAYKSPKEIAR